MFPDEILPYPTKYRLEFSSNSSDDDEDQVKKSEAKIPPTLNDKLEYFPLAVVTNQRVTAESHFQDTRLITFDTCASSTSSEELLDSASQFFP